MTETNAIPWADPARAALFHQWLQGIAAQQQIDPTQLSIANADASFRRYLRVQGTAGQPARIIMDAPPDKENCRPFVHVAGLMQAAGLHAPQVLAWDEANGFMLLSDLGSHTMLSVLDSTRPEQALPLYQQALDVLLPWQQASRAGELPPYDAALLQRELQLFPDWYVAQHLQLALSDTQRNTLAGMFDLIVQTNLAGPQVYVHRDFMPRNLMLPQAEGGPLGVLDFQDAVYGPITYDVASLMRDAFISWEEDMVIDVTVRYWERARRLGLLDFEDWHSDFGSFYRACEWMGLQRHLKVAGIFARLTLRDGKAKYLADAPRFIAYIRHTARRYRELQPLMQLLDAIEPDESLTTGFAFGRV